MQIDLTDSRQGLKKAGVPEDVLSLAAQYFAPENSGPARFAPVILEAPLSCDRIATKILFLHRNR